MKNLLAISLGTVCATALAKAAGTNDEVPLARFYGEATGVQSGRGGQSTIMGDFRAINLETGEEFKSSVIYLPRGLQEAVLVALENEGASIRFAYDIWAEPEANRKSYNIGFADLLENPEAPDPLRGLGEAVGAGSRFSPPKMPLEGGKSKSS